ncbi:hypothetical protein AFCDBAGC_2171 [Methylobacterium cerastii]|uniref:Uncharacterized protein n=1 Tax=Methylobacterium cerastii TaxID=932741 RepID=A0ABQ4QHI1_9HYPH|nr:MULTISPECIES: hypothetical protein [Methylobacterium]TXM63930.1 hypothetical protein FV229_20540 [Methylobacterium sp. WL120]TXM74422.1 hypothetical protein FV226_06240 [Methylobacterium sp. WL12]TXM98584.1 hypothetical protein FV222_14220 [Methylobacterium sp. WL103]TXN83421.1 hypothetical protein FV234_06695 [Methylobacterium sp. WL8]GJD44305.1 hypothetical protein AFCDBAGC_2171 [Methylobacterium cerastii]
MPDFVAALLAAAAFCLALMALNALTRLVLQWHIAPSELAENGLLQVGGALVLARVAYRRAPTRRHP